MKIFCIIPSYNEEKNIAKVIEEVAPLVDKLVVVDDASTDSTVKILDNIKISNLAILKHTVNRGQGAALQTGADYAIENGADIIVHFDADGQFLAAEMKDLIEPIKNGSADVVLGSRFLTKKSNLPWTKKTMIFPLARFVNKVLLGVNLTDPQSGFRAMTREAAKKISIKQDRMAHCSEILHQIFKYKLKAQEVPITVIYHDFGQRFSGGIKIFRDILLSKLID
jgi:glycosyltransferase involved in cell wall biosynthesis